MVTAPEPQPTRSMPAGPASVFAVDDEEPMRNALRRLLGSSGFAVEVFASASEFLTRNMLTRPACILLDLNMPGMNGLELQEELRVRGATIPIVFLTGAGTVAHAVTALQRGAADFIEKPFSEEDLIERVNKALETDRAAMEKEAELARMGAKLETLAPREKQVLLLVAQGKCNKLIARALDLSPRTVEGYRARVFEKLEVKAVVDLVRIVQQCEPMLNTALAQFAADGSRRLVGYTTPEPGLAASTQTTMSSAVNTPASPVGYY